MFDGCTIRGRRFAPARFCAPLVGYTHSAFRRLLADLGGCGGIWTEMLAGPQLLCENFETSPWVRRRPQETSLVYQLMLGVDDPVERILGRLQESGADALDLNLACNARRVRSHVAGSALFQDIKSLAEVLQKVRNLWPHVLTAKIRLGYEQPEWRERFVERVRLLEDSGVDAIILHPRFFEERFKRRARSELYPWAASLTQLPLIANGDLAGPGSLAECPEFFQPLRGIMLGRMAVARPWIFATWNQPSQVALPAIWDKMYQYVAEDFSHVIALRRLKMFTKYFASNYVFGHQFNVDLARASSLQEMRLRAHDFFSRTPAVVASPTVAGL